MGHLTSNTKLINDDIIVVMSFRLILCELRLWSTQPCLFAPSLRMTFSLSEKPSLTRREFAPRRSSRYLFTILGVLPRGFFILGENHQAWDWLLMISTVCGTICGLLAGKSHKNKKTYKAQFLSLNYGYCLFFPVQDTIYRDNYQGELYPRIFLSENNCYYNQIRPLKHSKG